MNGMYILDEDGNPKEEKDTLTWGRWFETSREKRIVGNDTVGDSRVSTVFLALDNSFGGDVPILYETMIFGGERDGEMERYATKKEAEEGHKRIVESLS